ncbi:hypothetical protein JZO67_002759 [Enterococcus sp. 665A]|uniref:Cyclic nucleotide-binding domain-containing protein n=1 Tax=Candidatus Enterococcus ferrettii TaxID=2815324 RepID=A0ABV0EQA2_9ENTE
MIVYCLFFCVLRKKILKESLSMINEKQKYDVYEYLILNDQFIYYHKGIQREMLITRRGLFGELIFKKVAFFRFVIR